MEVTRGRVVELLHRLQNLVAVEPEGAHPQEVGLRILDPRRDRAEVARAELVLEVERNFESALLRDLPGTVRLELRGGEFAGDDRDRRWRMARRRQRVEDPGRHRP